MPTTGRRIKRLTKPNVLRQIQDDRLIEFLSAFSNYFESVEFPIPSTHEGIDVEKLIGALSKAQRDAPDEMLDALFLVDQMATVSGRDALKRVLEDENVHVEGTIEWSPADLAVEVWLRHRPLLARAYASQLSTRNRTLQIFLANDDATIVEDPTSDEFCTQAKSQLATRLHDLDRGDVDIFPFRYEGGVRYVVQYGGVYVRHGVWNRGQSPSTVGYQPLEYDVVVFDSDRRELAIKRNPPVEQKALREAFSVALASDPDAFPRHAVLDLTPIRSAGEGCLWCRDVPGIRRIRLKGIKTSMQPALKHTREERATDLFEAWSSTSWGRVPRAQILKAEFEFEFDDCKVPRAVTLDRGASIRLTRDDDSDLVNEWLRRRCFVLGAGEDQGAPRDLWGWLERPEECLATESEWRSRLGESFSQVEPLLVGTTSIASSVTLDGEDDERTIVPGQNGGLIAVCQKTGSQTAIDPVEVTLRRLAAGAVAKSVAEAMSLEGVVAPVEDVEGAWTIGEFIAVEGERFPVYFVAVADERSLRSACNSLSGISGRPFVLVTPTRRFSTPKINDRLGATGSGWIALSESARLHASGRLQLRLPLQNLLRPFLAIQLPDLFGQPRRPRFPTPPGAQWSDVRIRFTDAHSVQIKIKDITHSYTYEGMGMNDKRTPRPTNRWTLLHSFATGGGKLTWDHTDASPRNKKRRERLADDLRAFFGIDVDPFEYDEDLKGWRAKFIVEPD